MNKITVMIGKSSKEANWKAHKYTWSEFARLLSTHERTAETMTEYHAMNSTNKAKVKDGKAFVGATFKQGGRRSKKNIKSRTLITLDIDYGTNATPTAIDSVLGNVAHVVYSTHSHRKDNQHKYRLVAPTNREMTPDEYGAVVRWLANEIGMKYFDHTSFEVNRLLYFPRCSNDAEPYFYEQQGDYINVDSVLETYKDWRVITQWSRHPEEQNNGRKTLNKMKDPTTKTCIVGAFCRAYTITEAIARFISDTYAPTDTDGRWSLVGGSTSGGLVIYDDMFTHSHHSTDSISGLTVNAFDLIRIHRFGELDDSEIFKPEKHTELKSYKEMVKFCNRDELVLEKLSEIQQEQFQEDFGDIINSENTEAGAENEETPKLNFDYFTSLITNRNISTAKPSPVLISDTLRQGEVLCVAGPPKIGKTMCMIKLASALQNGGEWLGRDCTKSKVLFINPEVSEATFHARERKVNKKGEPVDTIHLVEAKADISFSHLMTYCIRLAEEQRYNVFIFDSIYMIIDAKENDNDETKRALLQFNRLKALGTTVIYSHHHRKGSANIENSFDRFSGAGVHSRFASIMDLSYDNDFIGSAPNNSNELGDVKAVVVSTQLRDFKTSEEYYYHTYPEWLPDDGRIKSHIEKPKSQRKAEAKAERNKALETRVIECWKKINEEKGEVQQNELLKSVETNTNYLRDVIKSSPHLSQERRGGKYYVIYNPYDF